MSVNKTKHRTLVWLTDTAVCVHIKAVSVCYNMCLNRTCFPVNTTHLWHNTFSCHCQQKHLLCFTVASSAPPLRVSLFCLHSSFDNALFSVTRSGDALKPDACPCTMEPCGKILSSALIYMPCILLCKWTLQGRAHVRHVQRVCRTVCVSMTCLNLPWHVSKYICVLIPTMRSLYNINEQTTLSCPPLLLHTWYSPAVYLCVSLSPVHLWSHGLELSYLRERREETVEQNEMDEINK